jgi:YVTN family beta-propeller protein
MRTGLGSWLPGRRAARGRAGVVAGVMACAALALALVGCSSGAPAAPAEVPAAQPSSAGPTDPPSPAPTATATDVYAADSANALTGAARAAKPLVYVPNGVADTVQVIDPSTYRVVGRFRTGREPQHVVPSWDLKTLWVNDDLGNDLIPIDPRTGRHGKPVAVQDPYNLYFTPDGAHALVMAERMDRIDVRDPHTMKLQRSLSVPCHGVNHADYSADLSFFVASCEFSGKLLVVDKEATKVLKVIDLNKVKTPGSTSPEKAIHMQGSPKQGLRAGASAMPQDVRLMPDGKHFVVADMLRNGVWVVDATTLEVDRFVRTGIGAHGIYPSRDARRLFVSNRDEGTVSVLDATTLAKLALWTIPGGGSPDMGGVTADGRELWLSGRYDSVVYVFDTSTGKVSHRIPVDAGPHGLCVWPQPGRFSLGHTGNLR